MYFIDCAFLDLQLDAFVEVLLVPVHSAEAVDGVEVQRVELESFLQVRLGFVGAERLLRKHTRKQCQGARGLADATVCLARARVGAAHASH